MPQAVVKKKSQKKQIDAIGRKVGSSSVGERTQRRHCFIYKMCLTTFVPAKRHASDC